MSEWSDDKAALALRLIEKRGTSARVERRQRGTMTASGDRADTVAPTTTAGVLLPGEGEVEVEGVKRRRGRILLAAIEPEPEPGDRVVIQGQTLLVTNAKNMRPDGGLIYSDLDVAL